MIVNIGFGQQILTIAGSKAMMEERSVKLLPIPEEVDSETQFWMVPGVNGQVGLLAHKPALPNFQDRLLQDGGQGLAPIHHQLLVEKNVGIGQWTLSIAISISLVHWCGSKHCQLDM